MDVVELHPFMNSTGNFSKFVASLQIWGIEQKRKGVRDGEISNNASMKSTSTHGILTTQPNANDTVHY